MNKENQRIAIAEACGWKVKRRDITGYNVWEPDAEFPAQLTNNIENKLPDYLNDLNAMHEAEKVLTPEQLVDYCAFSLRVATGEGCVTDYKMIRATASHRAEAFLRTIGKWSID